MIPDRAITERVTALRQRFTQAAVDGVQMRPAFVDAWRRWNQLLTAAQLDPRPASLATVAAVRRKLHGWEAIFAAELPEQAAAGAGPLIWTPAAIHAEVEKTRTLLGTLNQRIVSDPDAKRIDPSKEPAPSQRRRAFAALAAEWAPLYSEAINWLDSGPSELWGATAAKCQEYQDRAASFASQAKALGADVSAFEGQNRPPPRHSEADDLAKLAFKGLLVYGAIKIIPEVLKLAQEITPRRKAVTS